MLMLALAALAFQTASPPHVQDPPAARGPYVDVSTGANRIWADRGSIVTRHERTRLIVTVERPEGVRSEHDYWFDCAARTYSAATWRTLNAAGEVAMHQHAQMRPAHRPVGPDIEPYRALACDGDDGGRPRLEALPPRG